MREIKIPYYYRLSPFNTGFHFPGKTILPNSEDSAPKAYLILFSIAYIFGKFSYTFGHGHWNGSSTRAEIFMCLACYVLRVKSSMWHLVSAQ